ncbi:MAG: acetate kinase [Firmicutes bacterium]|nr:acetate kinase [Bacillota bacterium]
MKILVLNCGSTTLRYQLIEIESKNVISKGIFERIGEQQSFFEHNGADAIDFYVRDHKAAVVKMFELLGSQVDGLVGIGHRVVHGGEKYMKSVIATNEVLKGVDAMSVFAPLHNPANLLGVHACMTALPDVPNVLVFDTAFHSTLPPHAYLYALPYCDYKEHGIRRYGFHGTSYSFVAREAAKMYGKPLSELRIVAMHLGGGASICAIDKGKSVETSMGMTPLEGLIMGTRCGDIDAGAVGYLSRIKGFTAEATLAYLNGNCGIKGLSGTGSSDFRHLNATACKEGDPNKESCIVTIDAFEHRLVKYIGSYIAVMGGVDAIVWTGGIGTNGNEIRRNVMKKFGYIGADIDHDKNDKLGRNMTADISAVDAKVKTFVVCTNEEFEIALETSRLVGK